MIIFFIFFALGIWLLQQQATLPDFAWGWLPILFILIMLLPRRALWQRLVRQAMLIIVACALGFSYAAWVAQQRLADSLPAEWQGKDIAVIGVVAELPRQHTGGLSFAFDVEKLLTPDAHVPPHVLLSTYNNEGEEPLPLHAGERWQLTLRLKQPHGSSNPHGFDFEAWMLENQLRASGYVRDDEGNKRLDAMVNSPSYLIESMREAVRAHFQKVLGDAPYTSVLAALSIGDQSSIPAAQWQVFTRTGVNHLMSISGLHITMLAGMAFALVYRAWKRSVRLTLRLPARKAAAIVGLLVALAYTLLSGFSVPAQRTVYMLGTVAAALFLSRTVAASQILAAALLVVLQQISLVSPIANAFAIPLVEFVVVPITLLGAVIPFDWILQLAHFSMWLCMVALEWLNQLPDAVWTQHAPPVWTIVLGMVGVLWCLLPRGFPSRWLGLLMALPMFLILPTPPPQGAVHMVIFDVGQGMSIVAQTHDHALLDDTGPGFSEEANSGNRILIPSLRAQGIAQLDELILSHDDTDHTGGALSVMQAMPIGLLSSSLPDDSPILLQSHNHQRCADGQNWDWDGIHFEILHPSSASYADEKVSKNNRGCTLRISVGKNSVLLAADIEKKSEERLLELHPDKLAATLLVVPHHSSKTSSTQEFVEAVQPRYAVFTAGYRNKFGHSKEEVVERYRVAGSELLRSDADGAIVVDMDAENFSVERYRKTHARYWTHSIVE